jgi:hypothetical protein
VTPVNDAPDALDDLTETPEDTPVTVPVLTNDQDIDGDTLTVDSITQPTSGTAVLNADGTITYTPNENFSGDDSFTYTVSDGNGGTDTATVTITVTPVNDAPVAADDLTETPEDTPVTVPVLTNDQDIDGDTLTVDSITQPTSGTAVLNPDGTVTYTPNENFSGDDSFTYTVSDGNGGTDTATVTITVTPVNDAPVAEDDTATAEDDMPVTIPVLDNDVDVDGDDLMVESVSVDCGLAEISSEGAIIYTPDLSCCDTVTITYTVTDGELTDTATVTVTILDTTAPEINCAGPETIECPNTPTFSQPTVTDQCDPNPAVTFSDETVDICAGSYEVTRTWTATDASGNSATCGQTITVQDTTAPVIGELPAPSTIECPAEPEFVTPTVTDACDQEPTLDYQDVTTPGGCPQSYSVTRTWTAIDGCGNEAEPVSQTINVVDTTAPSIACVGLGPYEFVSEVPTPAAPYTDSVDVADSCGGEVTVEYLGETRTGSGCQYDPMTITRTFRATDECGNSAEQSCEITVQQFVDCTIDVPEPEDGLFLERGSYTASVIPPYEPVPAGVTVAYVWTIDNNAQVTAGQGTSDITWMAGGPGTTTIGVTVTVTEIGGSSCTYHCEYPVTVTSACDTAFAYWTKGSVCFTGSWGWYTQLTANALKKGTTASFIANAGGCNPANGDNLGPVTLMLDKAGTTLTATFPAPGGCQPSDMHVYVGTAIPDGSGMGNWYQGSTITFDQPLSGSYYVAVHGAYCCL